MHKPRVDEVLARAGSIASIQSPEVDTVRLLWEKLSELWGALQEETEQRQQLLDATYQVEQYFFDVGEVEAWLSEQELFMMTDEKGKVSLPSALAGGCLEQSRGSGQPATGRGLLAGEQLPFPGCPLSSQSCHSPPQTTLGILCRPGPSGFWLPGSRVGQKRGAWGKPPSPAADPRTPTCRTDQQGKRGEGAHTPLPGTLFPG